MSSTVIVAWWGAILSTCVALWDVYKHLTAGPKLRFSVRPGVRITMPGYERKTLISANVANYGDRPTTITSLEVHYFEKRRFRRKNPDQVAMVLTIGKPLPFELNAGAVWTGFAIQSTELETWAVDGFLFMVLYHSHSKKVIRQRVVIKPKGTP